MTTPHPGPRLRQSVPPARPSRLRQLHLLPVPFRLALLAVLGASLLTLVLSELFVRAALGDGNRISDIVARQASASALMSHLADAEAAQRGYLLVGEPRYLEFFDTAVRNLRSTAPTLRRLVPADSPLANRLDRIDELTTRRLDLITPAMTLAGPDQRDAALQAVREGEDNLVMVALRAEMRAFQLASARELGGLRARRDAAANGSRIALVLSTLLTVMLLLLVVRLAIDHARADEDLRAQTGGDAERLQQVIASRTAELAALSSHIQVTAEKEKLALARDLHDEMGALLTAARMDLSWLQAAAPKDTAWLEKLQQLSDVLSQAMEVKQRVVESLRPALLEHFGLAVALQSHFDDNCSKAGLNCTSTVPEDLADVPDEIAIALFRVGQESLTNILRHAQARNVHLEIHEDGDDLCLEVRDDGVGMEVAQPDQCRSYGLAGMRHRVEGLGGRFEVASQRGKGTRIGARIPVRRS